MYMYMYMYTYIYIYICIQTRLWLCRPNYYTQLKWLGL